MTWSTQVIQAINTYAWLLEMVKINAFIIQLDKWKQLIWMLWYIDSLLKNRQNRLQVGSMAISILMSCFIYTKKYVSIKSRVVNMNPNDSIQLALCSLLLGQGTHNNPSTPVMVLLVLGIHRLRPQETLPRKVLRWVPTHQAGSCY